MPDRPLPGTSAAARADASDGMIVVGTLLAAFAVGALAGPWWAVLLLGVLLVAAGLFRAR